MGREEGEFRAADSLLSFSFSSEVEGVKRHIRALLYGENNLCFLKNQKDRKRKVHPHQKKCKDFVPVLLTQRRRKKTRKQCRKSLFHAFNRSSHVRGRGTDETPGGVSRAAHVFNDYTHIMNEGFFTPGCTSSTEKTFANASQRAGAARD